MLYIWKRTSAKDQSTKSVLPRSKFAIDLNEPTLKPLSRPLHPPPSPPALPPMSRAVTPLSRSESETPLSTASPTQRPNENFLFDNKDLKPLLVLAVSKYEVCLTWNGKEEAMLKLFLSTFLSHINAQTWQTTNEPSEKTLQEEFESLVKKQKEINLAYKRASGFIKGVSHKNKLLDNLNIARDEVDEEKKNVKDESTNREKTLAKAVEGIRNSAAKRVQKTDKDDSKEL